MNELSIDKILSGFGEERRIHYSLDRFKRALKELGSPEKSVNSVIIAGTNGKGTTTLLISAGLIEAGYSVATYLSPHLQKVNERYLFNLSQVSDEELRNTLLSVKKYGEKHYLSYFEFLTLSFFMWAKEKKPDFIVLEAGLGGRLDATNVTDPVAAVITNVSFDHQSYLGNTLSKILIEKLGILNTEGLLFTGITEPHLCRIIEKTCRKKDAIYYYSNEIRQSTQSRDFLGQEVSLNGYPFFLTNPSVGTLKNAALAFHLLRIVFPKIPIDTLQAAFKKTLTPGRMELIQTSPKVIFSGDHNLGGMECLKDTLKSLGKGRIKTLCGFSPDKPYQKMFTTLKKLSDEIRLTELSRHHGKMPKKYYTMSVVKKPKTSLNEMLKSAHPDDIILVTGSLYLVGELRSVFKDGVSFFGYSR